MKKTVIIAMIAFGLILSGVAFAQVYPVEGKPGMFRMSGAVDKYDAYAEAKKDGKIGRLYAYPYGKKKTDENTKKFYVTKMTKITKKAGGNATVKDLKAETVILITYRKTAKDVLLAHRIELQ